MSEKEGEPEPVWNQAVSFFLTCEVGLSLIFFRPEPAHVPFGIEHKHILLGGVLGSHLGLATNLIRWA